MSSTPLTSRLDHNGEPIPPTTGGPHGDREPVQLPASRVIRAGRGGIADVMAIVRDATRCPACGKNRLVANAGALQGHRQRIAFEAVTPETHCTCPAGGGERAS